MKKFKLLLLCFFCVGFVSAQCTINTSQTVPGLYPDTLPTGYVGQVYSQDITFVMPLDTVGYPFTNFHILSISLPVGLNWQCNNFSSNCDYNPQVNQYGCVNVSGTPLLAGQYNIEVTVIADLTVLQGIPVTFQVFMEILPSNTSVSNNGFSMVGSSGCRPVTVQFTNNNPGLMAYSWNFGNGNTSTSSAPSPQVYSTSGDFPVHYSAWSDTTTTHVYTLTSVTLNIQNATSWGYPAEGNADPYFVIKANGSTVYSSTYAQDDNTPNTWNLNLNLNSGLSYVLEVWDEDNYEFIFGGNDYLGSHTMNLNGCSGCAAGSDATASYTINHLAIPPTPSVVSIDTVHVHDYPGVPNIVFDSLNHLLSTDSTQFSLQWYFNNSPISGGGNATQQVAMSGNYYVVAINSFGCVSFSDTITAIYCSGETVQVQVDNNVLSTTDTLSNLFQWYDESGPIAGATHSFFIATQGGTYHVVMTDEYGCTYTSADIKVEIADISSHALSKDFNLYPNPAMRQVTMTWDKNTRVNKITISDLSGRVLSAFIPNGTESTMALDQFEPGFYIVEAISSSGRFTKGLLKQ